MDAIYSFFEMTFVSIRIQGHSYRLLVRRTPLEISRGMSIYASSPPHGMLFILNGQYHTFTMNGVSFPLSVLFLDADWNIVESFTAQPGMRTKRIPRSVMYMIEIPVTGIICE